MNHHQGQDMILGKDFTHSASTLVNHPHEGKHVAPSKWQETSEYEDSDTAWPDNVYPISRSASAAQPTDPVALTSLACNAHPMQEIGDDEAFDPFSQSAHDNLNLKASVPIHITTDMTGTVRRMTAIGRKKASQVPNPLLAASALSRSSSIDDLIRQFESNPSFVPPASSFSLSDPPPAAVALDFHDSTDIQEEDFEWEQGMDLLTLIQDRAQDKKDPSPQHGTTTKLPGRSDQVHSTTQPILILPPSLPTPLDSDLDADSGSFITHNSSAMTAGHFKDDWMSDLISSSSSSVNTTTGNPNHMRSLSARRYFSTSASPTPSSNTSFIASEEELDDGFDDLEFPEDMDDLPSIQPALRNDLSKANAILEMFREKDTVVNGHHKNALQEDFDMEDLALDPPVNVFIKPVGIKATDRIDSATRQDIASRLPSRNDSPYKTFNSDFIIKTVKGSVTELVSNETDFKTTVKNATISVHGSEPKQVETKNRPNPSPAWKNSSSSFDQESSNRSRNSINPLSANNSRPPSKLSQQSLPKRSSISGNISQSYSQPQEKYRRSSLNPIPLRTSGTCRQMSSSNSKLAGNCSLNNHKKKSVKKRPTLIRNLTPEAGAIQAIGDMVFNPKLQKWEGNEQDTLCFDKPTSSLPASVQTIQSMSLEHTSQFNSKTYTTDSGNNGLVIGNMIFDPVKMCWVGNEEEADIFDDHEHEGAHKHRNQAVSKPELQALPTPLPKEFIPSKSWRESISIAESSHKLFIGNMFPRGAEQNSRRQFMDSTKHLYELRVILQKKRFY